MYAQETSHLFVIESRFQFFFRDGFVVAVKLWLIPTRRKIGKKIGWSLLGKCLPVEGMEEFVILNFTDTHSFLGTKSVGSVDNKKRSDKIFRYKREAFWKRKLCLDNLLKYQVFIAETEEHKI